MATVVRRCISTCFLSPSPHLSIMIIIEVDCFRPLEAGIALPDDDLIAMGMTPAQIHALRMAQVAENRSASGFATYFPNDHPLSIQPQDYNSFSDDDVYVRRLSTITERTEKSEYTEVRARSSPSVAFSSRRSTRPRSSATESSYGDIISEPYLNVLACSVYSCPI